MPLHEHSWPGSYLSPLTSVSNTSRLMSWHVLGAAVKCCPTSKSTGNSTASTEVSWSEFSALSHIFTHLIDQWTNCINSTHHILISCTLSQLYETSNLLPNCSHSSSRSELLAFHSPLVLSGANCYPQLSSLTFRNRIFLVILYVLWFQGTNDDC